MQYKHRLVCVSLLIMTHMHQQREQDAKDTEIMYGYDVIWKKKLCQT